MTQAKTITVIIGDVHVGSTTALSTPKFLIHTGFKDETQEVHANNYQVWLWECWLDFWDYVKTLCAIRGKHRKHRLVVGHLGEFVDGDHHGSVQIMKRVGDQIDLSAQIHQSIAAMADGGLYAVVGTEAHSGAGGANDIAVAQRIGAREIDYELTLDIDGMLIDLNHHGRAGQRSWTSAAAGMAAEIQLDYYSRGMTPPRYAFRGHNHIIDDSGEKLPGTRVICTPSWQLRTAFGHKVAPNKRRSDIGGMILEGDTLTFAKARYTAAPGTKRVVTV